MVSPSELPTDFSRRRSSLTFYTANHSSALWILAHAFVNASTSGVLSVKEIRDEICSAWPDRFAGREQAILRSLSHNLSKSPDFEKVYCATRKTWGWCLTGSMDGVPRPDKRRAAKLRVRVRQTPESAPPTEGAPSISSLSSDEDFYRLWSLFVNDNLD